MRILIAGSRYFDQGYRVDRAMVRASKTDMNGSHQVVTVGTRKPSRGGAYVARNIADEWGWGREHYDSLDDIGNVSLCLAFLTRGENEDENANRLAMKAEKAHISTWRYYQ